MRGVARRAVVDGIGLAYDSYGTPGASTVVLLHALGETRGDWITLADRFTDQGEVLAVDLRGHGDSDRPGIYSTALMAGDVARLLDSLGSAGVTLMGHSLGGVVGYRLAVGRPDLVGRLVVEDVCPPFARDRAMPERPDTELPFDWEAAVALRGEAERDDPDLWRDLRSITAPTLLIGGGPTSSVPAEKLTAVADLIPDSELIELGGGHYVHQAHPEEFSAVISDWLLRRS